MDRNCIAVLEKINSLSPAGRYVIIAEDEFYEAFPEGCETSDRELDRVLTALRNDGYIDLKYSRGDMYCVAPLKDYAEEQPEDDGDVEESYAEETERRKFFDPVFFSAFVGGALGSLIISVIFAFV